MTEIALSRDPAHARHGSNAGQPLTRLDGPLKVTGRAHLRRRPPARGPAARRAWRRRPIARGRVVALDVAAAKAHPGVVDGDDAARTARRIFVDPDLHDQPFNFSFEALQNDRVRYAGQPIAVVIAETLEAATEGAALLAPRYESRAAAHRISTPARATRRRSSASAIPPAPSKGDVEAGLAAAALTLDATYETPAQYPQRDGAARHRRRVRRRQAGHRHADPGARLRPDALRADLRPSAREGAGALPVPRRRLRRQGAR